MKIVTEQKVVLRHCGPMHNKNSSDKTMETMVVEITKKH